MFTINIYLKLALIAICFVGGTILTILYGFGYSWILFLIGIALLISYLLLGTIQSASEYVQAQDFVGARKRLALTKFPNLLYVSNRAFYYIINGSIDMNEGKTSEAGEYFEKALALKLPTETERAMVLMQMANINASKNKWTAAKNYFRQAKKMNVAEPTLKQQMDQFEQALANQGGMKRMGASGGRRGQQMMRPGGKRRRPKMR